MHKRRGATAVEFALVMPVLLTFIGGIVTYSWVFLSHAALVDSVAEASRRASVFLTDPASTVTYEDQLKNVAFNQLQNAVQRAGWNPNEVVIGTDLQERNGLTVLLVQATAPLSSRFGGFVFNTPFSISYTMTVAVLDQPPLAPPVVP